MRENIGLYRGKPKTRGDYYLFSQNWNNSCKDGFVYGNLIISNSKYYICVSAMGKLNCCINNGTVSMIEVIPETVGEYTGLTDKNNKKIFEGDIVKFKRFNYEYIGKIAFNEKTCTFEIYFETTVGAYGEKVTHTMFISHADKLTIIGNIHDNSELLK